MKKGSKKALMDFLDVPLSSPVRRREGAYQSYTFGKGPQSVKVILLDLRYFRDSLVPDPTRQKRYLPNMEGEMLGETQWKWLENELSDSEAGLNILCSSVQAIADDHPYEKWGNFPNERKRLLRLITTVKPKNLLILSGDRHMAELSKMQIEGLPYPLYDFTSSGMTHIRSGTSEPNRYRVQEMVVEKNFGILRISWEGNNPIVTMEARGLQNKLLLKETVRY
jgi:alkaline phosphatase D